MVGMPSLSVMAPAASAATYSRTTENAPASSRATASSRMPAADSAVVPWTLIPPRTVARWGMRPMWPWTGIPTSTRVFTFPEISFPPSSFTASAPPSWIILPEFLMVSSTLMWYERNGRSPTMKAFLAPRATGRV